MRCLTNFSRRSKIVAACVGLILMTTSVFMKWVVVPSIVDSVVWSYMRLVEGTLGYNVSKASR